MGWWEEFNDVPGGNALRYYMGPAYRPVNALAQFGASLLPGADMVDMQQTGGDLMDYQGPMETLGDAGWLGLATLGMALPGRPGALREPVEDAAKGIRAYHGSPHDFDRFSMDKIGTGEGAQAYGHGLYFAENEAVAKDYRATTTGRAFAYGGRPASEADSETRAALDWLTGRPQNPGETTAAYLARRADELETHGRILAGSGSAQDAQAAGMYENAARRVRALDPEKLGLAGHMYEVNIAADPDDFLDWDKPLSEQSERVRGALADKWLAHPVDHARQTGRETYMQLPSEYVATPEEARSRATAQLREAGIPGIRYLDQGSRAAGDGSRNYVVFDENLISILRKYGLLGAIGAGAGANALEGYGEEGHPL